MEEVNPPLPSTIVVSIFITSFPPIGSRIFIPTFAQPTVTVPNMGTVISENLWGGSSFTPSQLCYKGFTIPVKSISPSSMANLEK